MTDNVQTGLKTRIDAIEEAYEFFLGYAARGTDGRSEKSVESGVRPVLGHAIEALEGLETVAREEAPQGSGTFSAWIDVLAIDIEKSLAGMRLVADQPAVSSQLVDNLNASIHLRALLTDLFVLDEALKASRAG